MASRRRACSALPSASREDAVLPFDISTRRARALAPSGPPCERLGARPVERLLAFGASQAAGILATSADTIQALTDVCEQRPCARSLRRGGPVRPRFEGAENAGPEGGFPSERDVARPRSQARSFRGDGARTTASTEPDP